MRSFLHLAKQAGLVIVTAREVDRMQECLRSRIWDEKYLQSSQENEDDGTEMDRRRWLLVAELKWSQGELTAG